LGLRFLIYDLRFLIYDLEKVTHSSIDLQQDKTGTVRHREIKYLNLIKELMSLVVSTRSDLFYNKMNDYK